MTILYLDKMCAHKTCLWTYENLCGLCMAEVDEDKATQYTAQEDHDCPDGDLQDIALQAGEFVVCFQRCNESVLSGTPMT